MSDRKLLIILICVIVVQSVMTLTHPAYRYYRTQAQSLRDDYLRFERQVRDDFVPAITNFAFSVPRGTLTQNVNTENVNTKSVNTENVNTENVNTENVNVPIEKPPFTDIHAAPFSINDKMGFSCRGFYYFEGDTFMGSRIISIDGAGFRLANGYVKFTEDVNTKNVNTQNVNTENVNTKNVNDDNIVWQYPDVWFGDYYF